MSLIEKQPQILLSIQLWWQKKTRAGATNKSSSCSGALANTLGVQQDFPFASIEYNMLMLFTGSTIQSKKKKKKKSSVEFENLVNNYASSCFYANSISNVTMILSSSSLRYSRVVSYREFDTCKSIFRLTNIAIWIHTEKIKILRLTKLFSF